MTTSPPEDLVADSSLLVPSFNPADPHRPKALPDLQGLESGRYRFHLPHLALTEVCLAVARRTSLPLALEARRRLLQLESRGFLHVYDLDKERALQAVDIALKMIGQVQKDTPAADLLFAQLAEEKGCELVACDRHDRPFPYARVLI